MHLAITSLMSALCLLSGAGCLGPLSPAYKRGQASFSNMQAAVRKAGQKAGNSLVYLSIQRGGAGTAMPNIPGLSIQYGGSRSRSFVGIVLSSQGQILVPEAIKPDSDDRIEAWIGDTEYVARPLKFDEQLGMTILKIDADEPLVPLNIGTSRDLAVGEWAVVTAPSGEATDYQKFTTVVFCRGEEAGRYRRFTLSGAPSDGNGAPVFNMDGELVGLLARGAAVSFQDLREDLQEFLAEATGARSPEQEAREKGVLGVMLEPVNKQYAKMKELPGSALWVVHVIRDSAAEKAGLRVGDLIVGLNGQPLRFDGNRVREYFMAAMRPKIGKKFSLTVLRGGERVVCEGAFEKKNEPETLRAEDVGIAVKELEDADVFARKLAVDKGVLVTEVLRGSAAATGTSFGRPLLNPDDVIVEFAGQPTPSVREFARVLDSVRGEKPAAVLVKYWRGAVSGYAGLNLRIGEKRNGGEQ